MSFLEPLEVLVENEQDYNRFNNPQKDFAHIALNTAATLKNLLFMPVLTQQGKISQEIATAKELYNNLVRGIEEIDKKYS